MYLAEKINKVLDSKRDKFKNPSSYFYLTNVLNRAFQKEEPFKFKFELFDDYGANDFSVSGFYDMEADIRYVILNFSNKSETITFDNERWREFRFAVSQVCQHEAIHKCQWQHRDGVECDRESLDFRGTEGSIEEEQEYLCDADEIDAYAHDIAMEIKFFYPKKNPYHVLSNLSRYRKIWSYRYYIKTFKGTEWEIIKNRLLKKTFLWLPHVTV